MINNIKYILPTESKLKDPLILEDIVYQWIINGFGSAIFDENDEQKNYFLLCKNNTKYVQLNNELNNELYHIHLYDADNGASLIKEDLISNNKYNNLFKIFKREDSVIVTFALLRMSEYGENKYCNINSINTNFKKKMEKYYNVFITRINDYYNKNSLIIEKQNNNKITEEKFREKYLKYKKKYLKLNNLMLLNH